MRPGAYSGAGVPNTQQSHAIGSRGSMQHLSHSTQAGGQQRLQIPRTAAPMRISTSGNAKPSAAASYAPLFDSSLSRAPFGGSLDGSTGTGGGSVDGDSVGGYGSYDCEPFTSGTASGSQLGGSQLQSYTVVKEIGGGGAGKAYLVTGKADGKKYVAKQIVCLGDQYKAAPASYALQETRLLFLLQHPHICGLVDFYPKSANFFIVMEYCEQGDLGKHISGAIRRGNVKFDAERIYTWWYQILDAIEFCHSKGVLHRDLKPKNIFIDAKLNVKVGDFGVSALISSPPAIERIGTVTYHAPEVKSSLQYSVKSDVWAIGVIMSETMQLWASGGEPVNISMINFSAIVPIYGQPARELLAMHLTDHPDQRPHAGALKESLMQLLQLPTRQIVASRAYSSSARSVTDAARHLDWMRPRTVPVPDTLKDNTSDLQPVMYEQDQRSDSGSGRYQWDNASDPSIHSVRDGGSVSSTDHSHATTVHSGSRSNNVASAHAEPILEPAKHSESAEVLELSEELGIYVISGTGGEFGAWKIAKLPTDKPAAKSKAIAIGEYLWEINGKIIFGMPFQLISSLIKGKSPEVKLGVKAGLALSIRNAVIRRDGDYSYPGNDAAAVQNSRDTSNSDMPASAPVNDPAEKPRDRSPGSHSLPKEASLPKAESSSPLLKARENSPNVVASPSQQTTGAEVPDRMEELVSEVVATQRMDKVVQKAQRSAPPPVPTPAPAAAPDNTEANAPAMALEPQGIRGMSSPIMQSTLSTPHVAAPAHIPSSFPGDSVESRQEGKTDTTESSSTEKPPNEVAKPITPTARGSATIAGDGQYSGELFEDKPFGMGTATWPHQGHTYVGEWRNGVMHGHGTATYLNGDRYDGEWANGKRSGLGRYAHGSGDIYEGLWSNERKHGLGVDSFADGRGYRGEFMENKFAGIGAYFTVDGAVYQGDWFQGKAHGTGISTSTKGGQPAFVQYSHGNLTRSEPFDAHEHEGKQERVEKLSRAAIAIALLARRVAALIQTQKLEPPMQYMEDLEGQALRECLPSISGTSLLGKALVLLAGVHSIVQEDSSLVVTTFEGSDKVAALPVVPGDIVYEVAYRSCSWYKGMTLDDIMSHLQSQQLVVGLKSEGMPPWAKPNQVQISLRQPGFVI